MLKFRSYYRTRIGRMASMALGDKININTTESMWHNSGSCKVWRPLIKYHRKMSDKGWMSYIHPWGETGWANVNVPQRYPVTPSDTGTFCRDIISNVKLSPTYKNYTSIPQLPSTDAYDISLAVYFRLNHTAQPYCLSLTSMLLVILLATTPCNTNSMLLNMA